jgi:hypothetical protein
VCGREMSCTDVKLQGTTEKVKELIKGRASF